METLDKSVVNEQPTGLEDITRSLRAVVRATRTVGEASADVVERELSMAISISEQIRDNVVSKKILEETRTRGLPARLREDAHRSIDLIADVGTILYNSTLTFLEKYADERRPALDSLRGSNDTLITTEFVDSKSQA